MELVLYAKRRREQRPGPGHGGPPTTQAQLRFGRPSEHIVPFLIYSLGVCVGACGAYRLTSAFLIRRLGACNSGMECFRNQSLDNLIAFLSIDGRWRGFPPEMY